MTLQELLAKLATLAELNDEDLGQLLADLSLAAQERLDADPTDEVLAELEQISDALATVKGEIDTRAEASAARQAKRDELAAKIAESTAVPDDEPVVDDDDPDPDAVVAATDPPLPTKPAVVSRVAARRPKTMVAAAPRELPTDVGDWGLVAAANSPDLVAGTPIRTLDDLGLAFMSAKKASDGYRGATRLKVPVVRAGNTDTSQIYDDSRILSDDPYANERKIQAVTAPKAIAAAGGICAPPAVRYDIPVLGSDERPVWNEGLVTYGVDRGRVTTINIPVIEDMANAVSFWTNANDITPADPTVKPCITVGCPDDTTGVIEAIVMCLKIGNFKARYFGELIEAYLRLAAVNAARQVETRHLAAITAGSTEVTTGTMLGTSRDVLTNLLRAGAVIRSRHRARKGDMPMRFLAPDWLRDNMRVDIARQFPVGTLEETFVVADAKLDSLLSQAGVNSTWLLDGPTGQVFGKQFDGVLLNWPSHAITWLYPEGTWLGLDGGTLDFGIVRDSTLNATNDFEMFSESMQGVHFHGVESWQIDMDICPDGSVSAAIDINPCTSGS